MTFDPNLKTVVESIRAMIEDALARLRLPSERIDNQLPGGLLPPGGPTGDGYPARDHAASHESSGDDVIDLGALAGVITDDQHGDRAGGDLHALATTGAPGFVQLAGHADTTAGHVLQADDPRFRDATSIQGIAVSTTDPTDGQALIYDSGSSQYVPGDAGSGGGGMADPMTATGDMIYADGLPGGNMALTSLGASATSTAPTYSGNVPDYAIDGNSGTAWLAATASDAPIVIDLGVARTISSFQVVQYSSDHSRSFTVESSPDNSTWTTRYTQATAIVDTGTVSITPVIARYWRLNFVGPSTNPSFGSGVTSILLTQTATLGPTALPIGDDGQVLTVVSGLPSWQDPAGGASYAQDIGDGSTTDIVVTHGLGTRDVIVQVYNKTTYVDIQPGVERTTTNTVTLSFLSAPTAAEFRVVIRG